jgi:type II secretory pathway component PulF
MARFTYTARDAAGANQQGTLEAPTRREALRSLSARGLRPLAVNEAGGPGPAAAAAASPIVATPARGKAGRGSRKLRLPFLDALSRLVTGGLSAGEGVRLLAIRLQDPPLRGLAAALWERLSQGRTLSDAMADFPEVFDGQTTSLIAAGEATGSLKDVLHRLIRHLTEQRELRSRVIAALAYPVFVCVLAIGVILFFLFFLLPRIQGLLGSLGGKLPLATQLLVWTADFLLKYGLFFVIAAVIGALAWWRTRATAAGRRTTDAWLLRLPFTGSYARRIMVLNFSHTVAILLENGITTAESLRLAERTITNLALRDTLHGAVDRVLEGEALATALGRTQLFPLLVLDQLAVGEQTGNLPASLHAIAEDSQREMTAWLQYFTRFIASIVLGLSFAFVAFLAYAIVSAVLEVSASFKF